VEQFDSLSLSFCIHFSFFRLPRYRLLNLSSYQVENAAVAAPFSSTRGRHFFSRLIMFSCSLKRVELDSYLYSFSSSREI
jgi:hypothetical protein